MQKFIKNQLKQKGFKMTNQRKMILQVLENTDTCLSAEEIFMLVKDINPSVCLTTIYRTIEILIKNNLLTKIDVGDNRYRYEIRTNKHHHHAVCLKCKKMICLEGCPMDYFEKQIKDKVNFTITGHRLEFYGYCLECK